MSTQESIKKLREAILSVSKDIDFLWSYTDGEGALVINELITCMREAGFKAPHKAYDLDHGIVRPSKLKTKARITQGLRTSVFERDGYRCKKCGTHKGLQVDHIHPESKGGTLDMENLQTLCGSCNNKKGAKI